MDERTSVTTNMPDAADKTSLNITESEIEVYRQKLSDSMAMDLLPVILILSIVLLIGVIGNGLVFYVYFLKFNPSSTRSAILALACLDLLTCALCIPGEILDLRFSYNFTSQFLCKSLRMVSTAVLMASGFTLVIVALDRYQRICHPMHQQLTANKARNRVIFACLAAVIFAIPAFIVYGLAKVPTNIPGVFGVECSTSEDYARHPLRIGYNVVLCFVFLVAFTILTVIYIFIGRQVLRQNQFRKTVQQRKSSSGPIGGNRRNTICNHQTEEADHSISDGPKESSMSQEAIPDLEPLSNSADEASKPQQDSNGNGPKLFRKPSVLRRLRKLSHTGNNRTRKTTSMLFFITVVFVISFLPHLLLKAVQAVNKNFVDGLSLASVIFYNIFVRSYFFNTAANAFVYGFCSPKFRHECQALFLRLTFWVKRRKLSFQSDDLCDMN